jgi:hypothetical protein
MKRLRQFPVSVTLFLGLLLSMGSLSHADVVPVTAQGQANNRAAHPADVDDWNVSTLAPTSNPNAGTPLQVTSCIWVDNGLAAQGFTQANGWKFTYAGAAASAFVFRDLKITNYRAWVVNEPKVLGGDNQIYGGRAAVSNQDRGGAVFGLKYTPNVAAGDPTNIHWLQGILANYNGATDTGRIDNPSSAANPTPPPARISPWYDDGGAAGTPADGTGIGNGNNTSWFLDIPSAPELLQPEASETKDFFANVQFQVFVAVDGGAANGIAHNVTIYGGEWWGYNYTASDTVNATVTPVPSTLVMSSILFGMFGAVCWHKRLKSAALAA